jgi:hypothetical protein
MQDKIYYKNGGLYWSDSDRRVGCINPEGYRVFQYDGSQYKEHRVIFEITNGYCPPILDHINGIKDDNRPENLRGASPNQNQYNRTNIKGYRKSRNKYYARISFEGKRIELGAFDSEQDAHSAYLKARELFYGEWHRTRFNELKKENSHALFSNAG